MEQIPPIIHESWHNLLQPLFEDKKMLLLKHQILPNCSYYPESKNIFRVFSMPLDKIKVIIVGQDPYMNPGEANGFAFAVNPTVRAPKSLEIIRQEIINSHTERDTRTHIDSDTWKELKHWHQQGVFLLNSALTVEFKNAGSHIGNWAWFTREVIGMISEHVNAVWMLWGGKAQGFNDFIERRYYIREEKDIKEVKDLTRNFILKAYHPAAEAYDPTRKEKFSGCNHFVLCNKILKAQGKTVINW